MPALSVFYGIIIYMYCEKGGQHNKPHIHAEYQDDEVAISLDGDVIEGKLPPKKLRMVQTWIDIHKEDLEANWKLLQNGSECFKIPPLR